MARKRTSPVHKYFKFNISTGKSVCQIESCGHELAGEHAKNLERHIESLHYEIFEKNLSVKSIEMEKKKKCNEQKTIKQKPMTQSKLHFENKNLKCITIELTANQLMNACTELVTVNGRPFELIEDSGFRKILNPLLKGLAGLDNGCNVINKRNVRSNVIDKSNEVVANIKDLVKNKLLCLKMDCASRKDKSILGINVQYAAADTTVTTLHTLAMIELTQKHTAEYLKEKVNEVLKVFEIKKQQILTITTDNARNFVKMVDLMHKENYDEELLEDIQDNDNTNNNPISEDLELDPLDGLEDDLVTVISNENNDFDFEEHTLKPLHVLIRCSVHTLQLCVDDALKSTSDRSFISKMREIVKKLRTPTVFRMIKSLHPQAKKAIIDVETRWGSSCDMLNRLLELKDVCKDVSDTFKELNVTDSQWQKTEILVKALLPAKHATVQLQKEDLTIGDFYGIWLKCYRDTKKVGSGLSNSLSTSMERREKLLLDNPIFLAGIYLDPRFQCLLDEDSKCKAINILVDVWKMILWLDKSSRPITNDEMIVSETHCEVDNHNLSNVEDDLEDFIKTKTCVSIQEKNESVEAIPIRLLLQSYDNIQRLHHSSGIRQYWQDLKLIKPELFRLAQVILSVPVTQVSVERCFSGLKFISSDLRMSLTSDMLDKIMIIRCNHIFDTINY